MARPHDLLWLEDGDALIVDAPLPSWATRPWLAVAPVVVRRATLADPSQVPVGLRGALRHERCAARVPMAAVLHAQSPEAVAEAWQRRGMPCAPGLQCLQALLDLTPRLNELPIAWGVSGGVGFALASGFDVLRTDSDLDLLLRVPSPHDAAVLRDVGAWIARSPARVDVQIEAPGGGFALREWLRTGGPVLLKTARGPLLVDDPWQLQASTESTQPA